MSSANPSTVRTCTTCQGVLWLRDRLAGREVVGGLDRARVQRALAEARWLLAALAKMRPCGAHGDTTELAQCLAERLEGLQAS